MTDAPHDRPFLRVYCTWLALCVALLAIRMRLVGFGWQALLLPYEWPRILGCAYYDVLLHGVALCCVVALMVVSGERRQRFWAAGYTAFALLSLIVGMVNYKAVGLLGVPANYQWLYYSDFLTSFDAHQAIRDTVTASVVFQGIAATLGLWIAAWTLTRLLGHPRLAWLRTRHLYIATMTALAIYLTAATMYLGGGRANKLLANPVYSFVRSMLVDDATTLATVETAVGPEDFQTVRERGPATTSAPVGSVRNVVFFVLESVPAEFVEPYGCKYPVTPTLAANRRHAMLFRNFYAHAPSTNKSLVSILCSIYPWISFRSITQEHSDIDVTSLSSVLEKNGYRTSFFFSSDLSHQNVGAFLERQGFEHIEDYSARQADSPDIEYQLKDGATVRASSDKLTADSMIRWVRARPDAPFFSIVWTVSTHHPYFVMDPEIDFGVEDPHFHRYLNAVHHTDAALAKILRMLEEDGLTDSTLVVVLGDHGEAFGRHNQIGHAAKIFEENVHIPLLLIHPELFRGEESATIGGLVDVAPTVLDLLRIPLPSGWQGRSMFDRRRSPRAYFFAPFSDLLFGYRDGNRKFIYNATRESFDVYDLARDPLERDNLAKQNPEAVGNARDRLAAWVQYQSKMLGRLVR